MTTNEYKEFIEEQLNLLEDIMVRKMMGEYLLYYKGQLFGGIYDNRMLIKVTKTNKTLFENPKEQLPYEGSKTPMLVIDNLEDKELLKELVTRTCQELEMNKK